MPSKPKHLYNALVKSTACVLKMLKKRNPQRPQTEMWSLCGCPESLPCKSSSETFCWHLNGENYCHVIYTFIIFLCVEKKTVCDAFLFVPIYLMTLVMQYSGVNHINCIFGQCLWALVCVCVCVRVFEEGEGGLNRCRICHGDICVPWRSSRGPLHLRNLQLSALTPFRPPLASTTRPARPKGGVYERKRVRKIEKGGAVVKRTESCRGGQDQEKERLWKKKTKLGRHGKRRGARRTENIIKKWWARQAKGLAEKCGGGANMRVKGRCFVVLWSSRMSSAAWEKDCCVLFQFTVFRLLCSLYSCLSLFLSLSGASLPSVWLHAELSILESTHWRLEDCMWHNPIRNKCWWTTFGTSNIFKASYVLMQRNNWKCKT